MIRIYKYFPRTLRHYNDFISTLEDHKTYSYQNIEYLIHSEDFGHSLKIKLTGPNKSIIYIKYYKIGFLELVSSVEDENLLQDVSKLFWSFAFVNSIISVSSIKNNILIDGTMQIGITNYSSEAEGLYLSVIDLLNQIGNHNRRLFDMLENLYRNSPFKLFLKSVQTDEFSKLSMYVSRLHHISQGVSEYKRINDSNLNDDSLERIENLISETTYLIELVNLTRTYFEKRYESIMHIKQNRDTRIALISSVVACIAAIYAIFSNPVSKTNNNILDEKLILIDSSKLNNEKIRSEDFYKEDSLTIIDSLSVDSMNILINK